MCGLVTVHLEVLLEGSWQTQHVSAEVQSRLTDASPSNACICRLTSDCYACVGCMRVQENAPNVPFWDNDSLAALLAIELKADLLMLMTDVNGLYTGPPDDASSEWVTCHCPLDAHDPPAPSSLQVTGRLSANELSLPVQASAPCLMGIALLHLGRVVLRTFFSVWKLS